MNMSKRQSLAIAGVLGAISATSNAAIHELDFTPQSQNSNGGQIDRITARFNDSNNRLDWSVEFGNQVTEGFTLALSPGQNPKNHPGELALFYFDASDMNNPRLTSYAYNGENNISSYEDGDTSTPGDQTPDLITVDSQLRSGDIKVSVDDNTDGTRTLGFSIDATSIIEHNPLFPSATEDWTGASFAEKIGIWFHTFRNFDASYDDEGRLISLNKSGEGWFDGANIQTQVIPLPGAAAMTLAGLGLVARRRRNAAA